MDHILLKKFIEEVYCMKYNPNHILPQIHKNTEFHKYFIYNPGFLETEFYYDVLKNKFTRMKFENNSTDWDSAYDDSFS